MEGLDVITLKSHARGSGDARDLFTLFHGERSETTGSAAFFDWLWAVWFVTIAALGIYEAAMAPEILKAMNPLYGVSLFL